MTYDPGTGLVLTASDENNQVFHYVYDALNRSTSVTGPLSLSTTYSYDDNSAQPGVTRTTAVDTGKNVVQITTSDGLGRVVKQQTQDGAGQNASIVETQYDSTGRVSQVSNPHGTSETAVWTQKQYDALSRVVKVIPPDGSATSNNTQFSYSGNATTVTDPAGKQRRSFTDAAGRLIEVDEPGNPSSGTQATTTLTVSGAEQSTVVGAHPATQATASVTISGSNQFIPGSPAPPCPPPPQICDQTPTPPYYDNGKVYITINGHEYDYFFGNGGNSPDTAASVAQGLVNVIQSDAARVVNASVPSGGTTITLTAVTAGSAGNSIAFITGYTWDTATFTTPSFTTSPTSGNLSGGAASSSGTTVYDSGTVTVTIGGSFTASAPYTQSGNNTASMVASVLAGRGLTGLSRSGSPVTATVSGSTITVTYNTVGAAGNETVSSSTSYDSTDFSSPSFTASGANLSGGADPYSSGIAHPFSTLYTYDVLDDLAQINQGVQQRNFVYDSLGNLNSAATPEAGTVSYTYNSFNLVSTRTDMRGVITTYGYDGLNRLQQVSYNVGTSGVPATSTVTLAYGTSATQFNNGRLTSMTDGTGSEAYTYDALGRTTKLTKTIGSTAYPVSYAYDIVGSLKSVTYPSGRIVTQSFDTLERLTQVTSSSTNYVSGIGYNSAWEPTALSYGSGVTASFGYNARMQLASLAYAKGTSTLFSLAYGYSAPNGGNNGQIQRITDNVDNGRTVNYTYDLWNRLIAAQTTGSASSPAWGLSWSYDRYGNRLAETVTAGTGPSNSLSVDATTNRINTAPYAYDAAGNLTNDGLNTLVYNAENRVVSNTQAGATSTYSYDGNNLRVKKVSGSTTTTYIFSGAKVIAEYTGNAKVSSPTKEYIYAGAQLVATIAGRTTNYHLADHLSPRVTTDTSGNIVGQQGHFPFGESWYAQNTTTKWQFTSYERDSESGNDYAMARYHVNRLGRFSSPDRLAGSIGDPQSLNRYAYVLDDPINLADPSGMRPCPLTDQGDDPCGGGGTCTIDGMAADCGMAQALLQMGAAVELPPGLSPSGFINGQYYYLTAGESEEGSYLDYNYPGLTPAQIEALGLPTEIDLPDTLGPGGQQQPNGTDQRRLNCISKALKSKFGVNFQAVPKSPANPTPTTGGHINSAFTAAGVPTTTALSIQSTISAASSANGGGIGPGSRFGDGLHIPSGGAIVTPGRAPGLSDVTVTAHLDLYNPNNGFGDALGHAFVDYLWGNVKQAFGGNIDKLCE